MPPAPGPDVGPGIGAAEGEDIGEGLSLLEEGVGIILRSLRNEMEPTLEALGEDLEAAARAMGPALSDLLALIGDIRLYHAPERLPNGDIILRRKVPEPTPPEDAVPRDPDQPDQPGQAIDL
ncbi:MAG: AAA+ family ATPase [Alphaproteobacteria bacterium HGW-Alphaproteobacteria-6]|nr:MAG: AAA+ family ATPase [Alphaproteobacteria bacterium HGW-Alphaproteobacteria-6]